MKSSHVIILGGGATGAVALLRLTDLLSAEVQITIVEPRSDLGLGRAYSTVSPAHILNVPAERMSVGAPHLDFVTWCERENLKPRQFPTWPFLPRSWYGRYLSSLAVARRSPNIHHLRQRAHSVARREGQWEVQLDSGQLLKGSHLIVATGYQPQLNADLLHPTSDSAAARVLQPTNESALSRIRPNESVLIVGTGLTAIDVFRQLYGSGHRQITMLSRRGRLPLSSPLEPLKPAKPFAWQNKSPRELFATLLAQTSDARAVADFLRPHIRTIWQNWSHPQRRQFQMHLARTWDLLRHRMPVAIEAELVAAREADALRIIAGRIVSTEATAQGAVVVTYLDRKGQQPRRWQGDWVVQATAIQVGHDLKIDSHLKVCDLGLGYSTHADQVWVAGPAAKTDLWEITAMPEINEQAEFIAKQVAASLA